jgi:hypothetical protein
MDRGLSGEKERKETGGVTTAVSLKEVGANTCSMKCRFHA